MSKDHWVSQFLLRSFAVKGKVQAFDKENKNIFSASPIKICGEHAFTTFRVDDV